MTLCCNDQVRDGAMSCLVEIYRHVGERVRLDLSKKGLPQSRYDDRQSCWCHFLCLLFPVLCYFSLTHPHIHISAHVTEEERPPVLRHKEAAGCSTRHKVLPLVETQNIASSTKSTKIDLLLFKLSHLSDFKWQVHEIQHVRVVAVRMMKQSFASCNYTHTAVHSVL